MGTKAHMLWPQRVHALLGDIGFFLVLWLNLLCALERACMRWPFG